MLGFALEATNARENALQKLRAKNCDWIVLNGPAAIGAETNSVEVLDRQGQVVTNVPGTKTEVARHLIDWIEAKVHPRATALGIERRGRLPMTSNGKVYLVGAGPGDPGLMTVKGLAACRGPTWCCTTAW